MGCDGHFYLDYDDFKNPETGKWHAKNVAKLNIDRNYLLFAIMAGIRKFGADIEIVSEPKGLPSRVSYRVKDEFTLYVMDDDDYFEEEGSCSRTTAERWAKHSGWWDEKHVRVNHPDWHSASWLGVEELKRVQEIYSNTQRDDPDPKLIRRGDPIPEGYVASERYKWCNTDKTMIVEEKSPGLIGKHIVLESIIKMMEELNDGDGNKSKLIFWFDN